MKVIGIIPARYESSRMPHKVLSELKGKTILQRVCETVKKVKSIDEFYIATSSQIIREHCNIRGLAPVFVTVKNNRNAVESCAEVAEMLKADIYVNIQSDRPLVTEEMIEKVIENVSSFYVAALIGPFQHSNSKDIQKVKCVISKDNFALYYSRAYIPFEFRNIIFPYLSGGVYGYKRAALCKYKNDGPSPLEEIEGIDQLRFLENGIPIKTVYVSTENFGIDCPADLVLAEKVLNG